MLVRIVVLAVLTACGRIGFDDVVRAGDDASPDTPAACATMFADDFGDDSFTPLWTVANGTDVTVAESGGVATIALAINAADAYGEILSACRHDMRDREVSLEILAVPDGDPKAEMFLELAIDGANRLGIDYFDNNLQQYHRVGDVYTALDTISFDALAHRFWRLREVAGEMFWQSSPDRLVWIDRASVSTPLDVSAVLVGIHAGTFDAATSPPGAAVFDNLDVR